MSFLETDGKCFKGNCDPQSECRRSDYGHDTCQCVEGYEPNEDRYGCGNGKYRLAKYMKYSKILSKFYKKQHGLFGQSPGYESPVFWKKNTKPVKFTKTPLK